MEQQNTKEQIYFPELDNSKLGRNIFIGAGILLIIYLLIVIFATPSPKIEDNDFIKKQVDSLAKVNADLQSKQASLDSLSKGYESNIQNLDWKINNIGQSKTIIKEYYHEKIKEPATYTPKQIDSFFKDRYKY